MRESGLRRCYWQIANLHFRSCRDHFNSRLNLNLFNFVRWRFHAFAKLTLLLLCINQIRASNLALQCLNLEQSLLNWPRLFIRTPMIEHYGPMNGVWCAMSCKWRLMCSFRCVASDEWCQMNDIQAACLLRRPSDARLLFWLDQTKQSDRAGLLPRLLVLMQNSKGIWTSNQFSLAAERRDTFIALEALKFDVKVTSMKSSSKWFQVFNSKFK